VPNVARFRVISTFLAVRAAAREERFMRVPPGAILETTSDLHEPGLVTVMLDGESLLVFSRDITECTEPVKYLSSSLGA
jgi:hypothetical protein